MPLNNPTSNASNVSEYQVSGVPYVTASTATEVIAATTTAEATQITFPNVTQWFSVFCIGSSPLHVGFTQNGVRNGTATTTVNRITLDALSGSIENVRVRCKELFFLGNGGTTGFQVIAGLTCVNSGSFPFLTSSLVTSGGLGLIGVG